jgi:hypothetical protein
VSLLREIQQAAVDEKIAIETVLLKCQLLAARVGHDELAAWVQRELNGYGAKDLPDYRKVGAVTVLGTFSGPFQSGVRNQPLTPMNVDQDDWEELFTVDFRGGMAGYEDLLRGGKASGNPVEKWPGYKIQQYQLAFIDGYVLRDAWKVVPRGALVNLVSQVRSRVLGFAAQLERVSPNAGDAITDLSPDSKERIIAYVYGDNANLSLTHGDISGGQTVASTGHAVAYHAATSTDRMWFVRHPWWSAGIVGLLVGLPGLYLAIWGTDLPW